MPNKQQIRDFNDNVVSDNLIYSDSFLQDAMNWIAINIQPEYVFNEDQLTLWAETKEPDDIFSEEKLTAWAEENGYTKVNI